MKQWTKLGLVFLVALLLVCCAATAMAADPATCKHELSGGGNAYAWVIKDKADCTTAGLEQYKCSLCGYVDKTQVIAALGHDQAGQPKKTEKDATCTEAGVESTYCARCWKYIVSGSIPALGHEPSALKTSPGNCTTDEYTYKSCTRWGCTAILDKVVTKVAPGHKFVFTSRTPATCAAAGYDLYTCSNAGCTETKKEAIAQLAHQYPAVWTVETAATCSKEGVEYKKCELCENKITQKIGLTGHDFKPLSEGVTVDGKVPTCTTDGLKRVTCKNCTATQTVTDPAIGHKYDEKAAGKVKTAATCTVAGVKTVECSNGCKTTKEFTIDALGHDMQWQSDSVDATCEVDGLSHYKCDRDGCTYEDKKVLPAIGHKFNEKPNAGISTAPTCEKEGEDQYKCQNVGCKFIKKVVVPALGHDYEVIWTYEPTCNTPGANDLKCKRANCGKTSQEPIPATGHTPEETFAPAPTCLTGGVKDTVCEVCGYLIAREAVPALGHTAKDQIITAATCTTDGLKNVTCAVCKLDMGKDVVIPAFGHSFIWETTVKPTVNKKGSAKEICSVCGFESGKTKELASLPANTKYYGNTISLAGARVRDLKSGITNDWCMVAPIDLTVNGKTEIAVVATNKYVVGKLVATVKDGFVTFTLELNKAVDAGNVFFTLFGSIDEITTIDTKSLTSYSLNKAYDIANELGGATKVLAFLDAEVDYDAKSAGITGYTYDASVINNIK